MQKLFRVTVDISKKIPAPAFEVNTNDLKSVKLEITITNGQSLLDLTGVTPRINIRKPDNEVIFQDCEIVDAKAGKVQIVLENQAYLVPGTHTAEIACYKGSEITAITGTFSYKSIKGIMNDQAVESKSEFTAIDRKLVDVQEILEDVRENGTGIDAQARKELQNVTTQLAETSKKLTTKFMHVSADDVINLFQDLTEKANTYTSIFNNPTLAFLKQMHDTYGMVFSGYVFYRNSDGTFNLSQTTNKFVNEFSANADWLKFGFHSNNSEVNYGNATAATAKADYEQVMVQLYRILGSWECIDKVPRLHNYAGNIDAMKAMRDTKYFGILGLLNAEDTRTSYYHNPEQVKYLQEHDRLFDPSNSITFFSTDMRLENVSNVSALLNQRKSDIEYVNRMHDLVIFTHEPQLSSTGIQAKIEDCCKFAISNGYKFEFPMNVILNGATGGVTIVSNNGDSPVSPIIPPVTIFDNFNRENSDTLGTSTSGHQWIDIGNNKLIIENNKATGPNNNSTTTFLSVVEANSPNVSLSADFVRGHDKDGIALVARNDGTSNSYIRTTLDNKDNGVINLHRIVNGTGTMVATAPYTFENGKSYNIRFTCSGDNFKVHIDGVEVINVNEDNPLKTNTKCGLRLYKSPGSTSIIDNFQVSLL